MKKRLWAIFLSICLVMTLLPNVAFAEDSGVTTEAELRAAIENATGTETDPTIINLTKSLELDSSIEIPDGKYIKLIGTSNDITISPSESFASSAFAKALIVIGHSSDTDSTIITSLELMNIVLDGDHRTRGIALHKGNHLTTEDVVIKNGATGPSSSGGGIAVCWHHETARARLSLSNTEIYGCAGGDCNNSGTGKYGGAINTYGNADVTLNNVNFHDNYAAWSGSAIYQGTLMLSGNIVLGRNDTGNGVYDGNIVITDSLGDSSEIYIGTSSSKSVIAIAQKGYTITQADLQKFNLIYVQHNNQNVADKYALYLDEDENSIKITDAVHVTLHANNETDETATQKTPNGKYVLLKANPFTYPKHTFVEWNSSQDGDGDSYAVNKTQTFTNDEELYAKWRDRALSNIEVIAKNTNVPYGTVLSTDDFKVTAVYDNGEREPITDFSISPTTALTSSGTVQVKVSYQDKTETCDITVAQAAPTYFSDPTYAVTAPGKTENGTVTVTPSNASKGTTVTINAKPDAGYVLGSLEVKDANGNALSLTDKGNGKYTFTMPAGKVEIKAAFAKEVETSPFSDVSTDAYYYDAVKWAQEKGITEGIGDGLFGSEQPCTRGQIVTFLWRAAGSPEPKTSASTMTDLNPNDYYKAVLWAIENGITSGVTDTTFAPDATCTRGQSVTFLYRALGTTPHAANGFADVAADSFCADAVAWAVENGVTYGTSAATFSPADDCTRSQIVTFLYRAYQGK